MDGTLDRPASQPAIDSGKVRYFEGRAHYFIDVTDRPAETVGERPVELAIVREGESDANGQEES